MNTKEKSFDNREPVSFKASRIQVRAVINAARPKKLKKDGLKNNKTGGKKMIVIYGNGREIADLKLLGYQECEVCRGNRLFSAVVQYHYVHLYFMGIVLSRNYYVLCDSCGNGWSLESKKAEQLIKQGEFNAPKIPVHTRLGLPILFGIFAALSLFSLFAH